MSYLGSWKVDDLLTFPALTTRFDTGVATDADSVPSYRVYENETATPILTGSMALLDSANTAGFYSEQITLSAANGFEKGKCYTIYIQATVNGVVGATYHTFQIEAEVDANTVSGSVPSLGVQAKADVNAEVVDVVGTDVIPDSVAADGSRPTINQALLEITRFLMEKSVSGTTVTVKKEDGSSSSFTLTLDSGTTPTSITRAT